MSYTKKFRNRNRAKFRNSSPLYAEILQRKNIRNLMQYDTALLPDLQTYREIITVTHIWKTGDRYYKLANRYYERPELWWVIALFNNKPTEGHLKKGDIVYIPTPINTVLSILGD